MEWLFLDITETVNVIVALMGVWLCMCLVVVRLRTFLEIRSDGINGRYRMLSILRLVRVSMLGTVFLLFFIIGAHAMTLPINQAIDPINLKAFIPAVAAMLMECVLFAKLAIEEFLEGVINHMQDMQDAAKNQSAPRLDC